MRCARCGNDNPDDNRFCGMCGATLLAPPLTAVAETQTQRAASSAAVTPAPISPVVTAPPPPPRQPPVRVERPIAEEPEMDEPAISGPSFLGLNDPAPRKRARLSIDPNNSRGSRGGHYLLDDDEEPRRGGVGKFLLILVALALALGFGYLRWKNHGFDWLSPSANKPPASTQAPDTADTGSTTPPSTNSTNIPVPAQNTPAPAQPSITPAQPPADSAAGQNNFGNPAPSTPPAAQPAAADSSAAAPPKASAKPDDENSSADKDSGDEEEAAPTPAPKKATKPNAAVSKPRPAVPTVPAVDSVAEARKYLYGKGATQDCDRGLRLLKPAANQANSSAMIEMGALYSAGLCTPRDLPTAYRWFALALRKEPENSSVQKDLQKLWGEMTQPERQLAIKLTQ